MNSWTYRIGSVDHKPLDCYLQRHKDPLWSGVDFPSLRDIIRALYGKAEI